MAFTDPIIGGSGSLIRNAIKSPNYVPGVSGWSINRDGTAEFNSVAVRGSITANNGLTVLDNNGIRVTNVNGSQVSIAPSGLIAGLALRPEDQVGFSWNSALIYADSETDGRNSLVIQGPEDSAFPGITQASLTMRSVDQAGTVLYPISELYGDLTIAGDLAVAFDVEMLGTNTLGATSMTSETVTGTSTLNTVTAATVTATGNIRGKFPNGKIALPGATQAIPLTTVTAISYTGVDIRDDAGIHNPASNPTRVTPNVPGVYEITLVTAWAAGTATNRQTFVRKNGATVVGPTINETAPTTAFQQIITATTTFNGTTDYFEHCVSSGVAINVVGGIADTTNPNTVMQWKYIASA